MLLFALSNWAIILYFCIMEKQETKTSTLEDMAKSYNVSKRTFYHWIYPIRQELLDMYPVQKKRIRHLFPRQIKRINEFLS